MSEIIEFVAEVYKVQTLATDGGVRVTLNLPETAIMQMAQLAECQRFGVPIEITCEPIAKSKLADDQTTFIYGLKDPRDGLIHYIGKSNTPKFRLENHLADKESNKFKVQWVETLLSDDLLPELVVLEEVSRRDWAEKEKQWIAKGNLEGWPLTNNKLADELSVDIQVNEFDADDLDLWGVDEPELLYKDNTVRNGK